MVFFWRKKTKQKPQKKSTKKPRSKTFILEEIISPGAYCPAPLDDTLLNHPIFGLFTEQELIATIFGPEAPPNIADIDTEILVQDYWEKIDQYFQENPSEANSFDLEDLSTWPTLEALINPGQPSVEIPDVGGAVGTLPPPVTVPVDPPRNNPGSGGQDPVIPPPQPPTLVNTISDITLTPETSSQTIDISQVFATPDGEQLQYEVISNNGELLNINLENNQLYIEALPKTGSSQITIQATTETGGIAAHTFNVFNNYVAPESVATINSGLTELQNVIDTNPDDLLVSLDNPEAQTALETLATELESNFDNIFNAIQQTETLTKAGVSPEAVATLEQLLASEEVGAALGLPTSVESALASEDFRIWDNYLINATEAASILLPDAPQTNVAFLDFADEHGENVTEVFESVNPNAEYQRLSINNGNWAQQLVQYVDNLKAAGQDRGIVNLSFDLSQVDDQGRTTTRYDLTEAEQLAIQYAQDNNVLLVAASGNTGGEMSALGKAAEKFDNIITVGAVNKLESVADYSSRGDTLTLVAPGGQYENDPNAFVGTSRATSYVTGAASLVWAANPDLSYQQVKELLTLTAKDLGPEGWDAETGAGLLDVTEAVLMAGLVAPEAVVRFGDVDISAFTGAGRVNVDVRAASPETEAAIQGLTDTQNQLFEQWQVLRDLGNDDVSLEELQNEIASRKSDALDSYRDVDTAAAISLVKNQESVTALGLAREHYQIELARLQGLLERQGQLQDGLVALTGERDELVVTNAEQLKVLEEAIARTEQELDDASQKLQYQLVDPDTLVAQTDAVKAEIAELERKITDYRQQSAALKAQADSYYAEANQYRQQQQHHTNIANNAWITRKGKSGRRYTERNTPVYNHHINIANQAARNAESATSQGDVFQANHNQLQQLTAQMEQQTQELKDYQELLESNNQQLSQLTGDPDDAQQILEALQTQAAAKTKQAEQYWQQAALAEKRRLESQDKANWHNSMINRHEVVGYRKKRKSRKPIYGWRHYPEHIAPRDQAQQQANNAEAERQTFEQWAQQAQVEADALNQQATALGERVADWPELKRGIEYEINAKQQQLQAEKDLLALQTPVQRQQLETLDLKINQTTDELQKLETEELPEQQQKTDGTEERLNQVQQDVEENQIQRSQTQTDLQNFLETYGYLLPYQERRSAVQKQIQQLETEKVRVQELLVEIRSPLTPLEKGGTGGVEVSLENGDTASVEVPLENEESSLEVPLAKGDLGGSSPEVPVDAEGAPLEVPLAKGDLGGSSFLAQTENYLNDIEQQLAYAKVQSEQLNLAAPDSPQRLAIGNLIDELAKRQQNLPETNTLPLQEYIDFLRGVENRNNNLLNGFDDLEERLTAAQTQQTAADETLQRLQNEYRDLGLAKADIETEKLMPSLIQALQENINAQQEILNGYQQQISNAHAVASNFEQQRQQHQDSANHWDSQINTWGVVSHRRENKKTVPVYGWIHNPQAQVNRDAAQAAANNAAQQRDVATQQAQQLEASLQPSINTTQATIADLQSKQQIFTDIENIQPNTTLEDAIALKETQINNTKTAINQTQDTINSLENDLAATKQAKSDKETEIVGQEGAIAQTQTDIGTTEANITAKQGEITQQQSMLQGYNNQINQANAVTNNFEQQRQQHEANANYWNERINTWGVTSYRTESYRYKSGKKWKTGYRQVPVYGWVYNPQAEANRNAELAAANNSTQQRDLAAQQAQQLTTALQPQIQTTTTNIAQLQTDKQNLETEKQNLQTQLNNQQQNLQNLQSELAGIEQNIGNIESNIATNEQKVQQLDAQLLKENSDKIYLQEALAEIDQRIADKELEISDKYEEIQLTEKYARHVSTEVDRLENRLELINQADALETEYQNQQDNWQNALNNQIASTEELLATRKAGENQREQLLSLQSQLADTQTQLATAQQQQTQLTTEVETAQEDLQFTQLQLGNQQLQLQSLQAQDQPLRSAEAHYYNLAQQHRQQMWYSNGSQFVYNAEQAAAYRANMELAARMAQQRNDNWPKIEETQKKIEELNQAIATQTTNIAGKQQELAKVTPEVANLTAKAAEIEIQIPPLVTALEPLQQAENAKLANFQNAVRQTETASVELAQTTKEQATALNHLISFGVLGTESDVDFFPTQVEAKVNQFIQQLQNRSNDLGSQADTLGNLITDWQSELDNTTDTVSRQALTDLIAETIGQQNHLLQRQQENQEIVTELSDRLTAAKTSLENLRQQQELEIRSQLNSNDVRLEALNRQLQTETAAENAVNEDTVLAYAQLNDQVRADLTASATQWVSQLQEGHQQTKEIGESQQNLSQSVDDLIEYIENNLAEVDGERDRNLADLRDAITTLGVVAPRRDEFVVGENSLKQEIEKLKQLIEQDAQLWQEIAPIAQRFGVESQELAEYQQQYEAKKQQDETTAQQYEEKRQQHENNANHWQSQINTWGVVGHRRKNKKTVPVYGWIHNPTAETNYNNELAAAETAAKNRDAALELPTAKAYREEFVNNATNNGTAIDVLQAETEEKSNEYSSLLAQVTAEEAQNNAQASAALVQADWYEKRAAEHWERSRKNGPTWTETRVTWRRGSSGKKKRHEVTITHVDHDWILWDTYSKLAPQLRQQAAEQLVVSDEKSQEQERLQPLAEQWADTRNATNIAEAPITASRNLLEVLETSREQIPAANEQLQLLEELLPEVEAKFAEAQKEADEYNAKVLAEWQEHDQNATEYINTIEDILERRGELNKQSQELQNQLADTEKWVEQQTVALDTETEQVDNLRQQLIADGETLAEKIAVATGSELTELQTKQAQLQEALGLIENKAVVLRQQQIAFSQKRTLLTAENEVILAEQRLLDAYLISPDSDFEELQQQLADARAALAEAQRLAEQAEASSQALTAPLQELQEDLLAQNDEHLQAAKARQQILKDLLEATELNANYTLEAAQKQQEVNDLEFQILQRLQEATAAGNEEAKHLLDVATQNDMATAAEIYYRDYTDLAGDKRSSSAGGVGTAEDRRLADKYYQEMQNHRQLQRLAQEQADHFGEIRQTAEAQLEILQQQQSAAAQVLQEVNDQINETQEQKSAKEQELAVAQARLDGIARIREQTEQTFVQLVSLERLNLAQAQLEQEIAVQRQSDIDEEVARRIEREQIELERQRLEARAKLEQLEQLQAEEELRQAVNQARADVGLDAVGGGSDPAQLQSDMVVLLGQLQNLEQQQPGLPDDVKALLADAKGDIYLALQGEEAENIQENLLKTTVGLVGQIQNYQTEIAKLDSEELWDNQLLAQAENDLQAASRELVEELQRSQALSGEREIINPLYIETLSKVAYAEQAVDISQDLAKQSKDFLGQILEQRKEERKARKKAFWNDLLSTVSTVLSILGTALLIVGGAGTLLASIGTILSTASAGVSAVQAAVNGDWAGAIFGAVMAGVGYATSSLGNSITVAREAGNLAQVAQLQQSLNTIQTFQYLASGAFNGMRAIQSGDQIMGFLQIVGGLAGAATTGLQQTINGLSSAARNVTNRVLNILKEAPLKIYTGIQAIENGDWLIGLNNVLNGAANIGQNVAGIFNSSIEDFFAGLDNFTDGMGQWIGTVQVVLGAIEEGGLDGLLSGVDGVLSIWETDLAEYVENLKNPPNYENFQPGNFSVEHQTLEELNRSFYNRLYDDREIPEGGIPFSSELTLIDKINDDRTEFDAFLLKDKQGQAIIVFRGSETEIENFFLDWRHDAHPFGVGYNQLQGNSNSIQKWIEENPGVTLTGHSLGGALAQFAAVKFPKSVGEVVTFNSPGLSGPQLSRSEFEQFQIDNDHVEATHYVVEGDPVSLAGNRFIPGDVYLLKQPGSNITNVHALGGRIGNPDIGFRKISIEELNDPSFTHQHWPYRTLSNSPFDLALFPLLHLLGRDRQTAEFTRTTLGLLTGTGLIHATP
ncbi:MAG: S8 family serine peptidase [Cyanobacteriota bacterium]|nr:S8 family serine peptidase [Cyanobacteriota bacterium]